MTFRNLALTLTALSLTVFVATALVPSGHASPQSDPLAATLEAHGGLERWQAQRTLGYTLKGFPLSPQVQKDNRSTVDLRQRRNRIDGVDFTVGFDGETAWSIPGPDAAGLPTRFFNLGSFYFIGMPFVFGDPGVRAESLEPREFRGELHDVVRITYPGQVGHSPDDDYVLYIDRDTRRLRLIHHTVTEIYDDARRVTWVFDEWQTVQGLLVPRSIRFYSTWNDGDLPGDGAVTRVVDVKLSTDAPDDAIYAPPAGAHTS